MEPAAIGEFLRHPIGKYVSGRSYMVWVASPTLVGNVHFGQPDARDLDDHRRMFDIPAHPQLAPPFDVLIDCSRLERVDLPGYELFVWYARHKLPRFVPLVRRLAMIPPPHLVGATLLGAFHQYLAPRFRAQVVEDRDAAFAWLDRPGAGEQPEVEAAIEHVLGEPALLHRFRTSLAANPRLRIRELARDLNTSERSLQRELARVGTSFRGEVTRARLLQAEMLLRDTSLKIEAVARRVGYASLASFSAHFRRLRGLTPSDYRRRAS